MSTFVFFIGGNLALLSLFWPTSEKSVKNVSHHQPFSSSAAVMKEQVLCNTAEKHLTLHNFAFASGMSHGSNIVFFFGKPSQTVTSLANVCEIMAFCFRNFQVTGVRTGEMFEPISKFLIGNRFHVTLTTLRQPYNLIQIHGV